MGTVEVERYLDMLRDAGFEYVKFVSFTGYKTAPKTVGASFRARKPAAQAISVTRCWMPSTQLSAVGRECAILKRLWFNRQLRLDLQTNRFARVHGEIQIQAATGS